MINDNLNTREDLIKLLKNYKSILSNKVINYLESLIELEFSVIKNNIDINDRIVLSELEIYKKIAIYNIYNKALKIFNENSQNLDIFFNQDVNGRVFIFTHLNEINVKLFEFNYNEFLILNDKIPKDYKLMKIGTVSLYKTLEKKEFRIE